MPPPTATDEGRRDEGVRAFTLGVRVLTMTCPRCAPPADPDPDALWVVPVIRLWNPVGDLTMGDLVDAAQSHRCSPAVVVDEAMGAPGG